MESAETGACLWMVANKKLFGIRIEKPQSVSQISYVGGDTLKISNAAETGAIPPPPTLLDSCYFANIHDDIYLVVHEEMQGYGFYAPVPVPRKGNGNGNVKPPLKPLSQLILLLLSGILSLTVIG
ncbi:hypothetical protein PIB30_054055 [Stylosanthes scabra]|uniref:Uncharacterized protein n=1 Tax=Stylosanthes scabra TaxID=79078 RepID=A0ABU6TJ25_9FABA|nr:hypothetical protein [Stylosanthes scabra]